MDTQNDLKMEEYIKNFEEAAIGHDSMVHIGNFTINKPYKIKQFRFFITKKLEKLVAIDFEDGTWAFIPLRLAKMIKSDDEIQALTNKHYNLIYLGRDENRMNMVLLDLQTIPAANFNISDVGLPKDFLSELMSEIENDVEGRKPKSKKTKR